MNETQNKLERDAQNALAQLQSQKAEREVLGLQPILMHFEARVKDVGNDILRIMSEKKPKEVVDIVTGTVIDAVDGNMTVERFSFQAKSEQDVLVFDGSYWEKMDLQDYYDFLNKSCAKAGLPEKCLHDVKFMERIYEQFAFRIAEKPKELFTNGDTWINLRNVTLEIKKDGTIGFHDHRREDHFKYVLPYSYDKDATCEHWQQFLDQMIPDKDTQRTLGEYIAYLLDDGTRIEKMLALFGNGSNGKSVVLEIIEHLMGHANTSFETLSALTLDPEKRAFIENKRVNISHETDGKMDIAKLKQLISGETVDARRLYYGYYDISKYSKFITSYNLLPPAEVTHGYFRRWILMPMKVTVQDDEQDLDLVDKLVDKEISGIFNWVLGYLFTYKQTGRVFVSDECKKALQHYKDSSDSVKCFITECCEVNNTFSTKGIDLHKAYKTYCYDDLRKPIGKQKFYDRMESNGIKPFPYQGQIMFHVRLTIDDGRTF